MNFRIFISSVQREFARERRQLAEYIRKDLVFSKFFDVFLFEEIPAGDASPKAVYLKEVAKSDVYLSVQVMLFKDRLEIWNAGSLPRGWTVKDLYRPHTSLPPNELIAGPMYLKGYIEKTGTGTDDVIRNCKAASIPPPVFTEGPDFRAVLYRRSESAVTRETTTESGLKHAVGSYEGSYERSYEILELIKSNPRILAKEIAAKKSISWRAVMKHIAHLKKNGMLRRIGPRKGGHWEVIAEAAK